MSNIFSKIVSLSLSIASRGSKGVRAEPFTKKLRVLSCFGNENIPPCPKLENHNGSYFCGGCGCPKIKQNALIREDGKYAKLDYPYLECPLKNPAFNNYEPAYPNETRKIQLEQLSVEAVEKVEITEPAVFEGAEDFFKNIEKLHKGETINNSNGK